MTYFAESSLFPCWEVEGLLWTALHRRTYASTALRNKWTKTNLKKQSTRKEGHHISDCKCALKLKTVWGLCVWVRVHMCVRVFACAHVHTPMCVLKPAQCLLHWETALFLWCSSSVHVDKEGFVISLIFAENLIRGCREPDKNLYISAIRMLLDPWSSLLQTRGILGNEHIS